GWNDPSICPESYLARLLIEHLAKGNDGNFEDVANFCMMLHQRGAHPRVLADALASPGAVTAVKPTHQADALEIAEAWAIWIEGKIKGEDGSLLSSFERDKATLFAARASPGAVTEAISAQDLRNLREALEARPT